MELAALIAALVAVLLILVVVGKTVRIVPQARARNVERFGRYRKTLEPGMNFIIPFVDRVKPLIDLREQVVSFKGAPVITEDNLVVLIDTVLFFQVTDPRAADYEIVNYIQAIEQITATMLRSVIGNMDLEQTLTSRDQINIRAPRRPRRRLGQVGHPGHPGGDQGHRPAQERHRRDGEADAGRAGEARRHAHRRGRQAGEDPHRRGREAEQYPDRRGGEAVADPAVRGPGSGDRHGVPGRARNDPDPKLLA